MPFFVVQQRMAKKMHQGLRPWNPTAPFLCYRNKRAEILFHINDAPRTTITSLALRGKNSPLNKLFLIINFSPKVCKASVFFDLSISEFLKIQCERYLWIFWKKHSCIAAKQPRGAIMPRGVKISLYDIRARALRKLCEGDIRVPRAQPLARFLRHSLTSIKEWQQKTNNL